MIDTKDLAKALGSSRVIPIDGIPCGGPLDLLRLAVHIKKIQNEAQPKQETSERKPEELYQG